MNAPGGKIISGMGGYTNIISPFTGVMTRLDVGRWKITREISQFHRAHSGTLGAKVTRTLCYDWSAQFRVWWDIDNPPESLLLTGWGCGIQFGIGSLAGQQLYNPQAQQQFYLAPNAVVRRFEVEDSSEGEDDEIVTADVMVRGGSLLFQLPQQLQAYEIYLAELTTLGQFSGLASFTTMQ